MVVQFASMDGVSIFVELVEASLSVNMEDESLNVDHAEGQVSVSTRRISTDARNARNRRHYY